MKVLITGKNGQLGYELIKTAPRADLDVKAFGSKDLDISQREAVDSVLESYQPDIVINAAAYTAVDKAESDIESAFNVNATGVENLAQACRRINAKLIHVSTDFVFDGNSSKPYQTDHQTNPKSVYGESKLTGEKLLKQHLPKNHAIIRTGWVYSAHGTNFVKTMLRLMNERDNLNVVYDQVGTPTWADGLARAIWKLVDNASLIDEQILHWSDAGVTSWYDFATAIKELAVINNFDINKEIVVKPIPAEQYPTPASRPSFSVLDKRDIESLLNIETVHWMKQLAHMMQELR